MEIPTECSIDPELMLVRAACMRCHGTKCPLFTLFFSLSLPPLLFSHKWAEILRRVLTHKINKIWGEKKTIGGPPWGSIV